MSPKNLNASNKTHKYLLNKLKDKQTAKTYNKFEKNLKIKRKIYSCSFWWTRQFSFMFFIKNLFD